MDFAVFYCARSHGNDFGQSWKLCLVERCVVLGTRRVVVRPPAAPGAKLCVVVVLKIGYMFGGNPEVQAEAGLQKEGEFRSFPSLMPLGPTRAVVSPPGASGRRAPSGRRAVEQLHVSGQEAADVWEN